MKKDTTICFQTSSEIRDALAKLAEGESQSVSSIVEAIIYQYLKTKRGFQGIIQNRRRFARKKIVLTAAIGDPRWKRRDFVKGTILDISLGGIKFSVPKGTVLEIANNGKDAEYSVIFTLPNNLWHTDIKCISRRVHESGEEIQIGASFVNPDYSTYSALQKYLI